MTRDIPVVMLTARGEKKIACAALKPARMTISPSRFAEGAGGANQSGNAPYFANGVEEVIEMQGLSLDPTSHRVMRAKSHWRWGRQNLNCCTFLYAS